MSAPPPPSGETAPGGVPILLITVVGALLALRIALSATMHLTEDEAYYRLWSMAPAFGYYDHPPMIAWWIWLGRHIGGDNPLGVRLLPILASGATSFLVFDLARLAGADSRTAQRAGVWFNAMPLVAAGGLLAVPDAPASLFWSLTLWCVLKAARGGRLAWWLAAGAAAGLAALSKYSALFLAPGIWLWFAWTPAGRQRLRTPGPWLAAMVATAVFALNLAWNADHHWLTFTKQFGRVAASRLAPRYLVEFVATQALLINPLIAMFAVRGWRRWTPPFVPWGKGAVAPPPRGDGVDLLPFVATSAPFIVYLVVHSLHDRVQAHWPAPVYPAIAVCAAVAAARVEGAWRRLRTATPIFGLAVGAAAMALVFLPAGILGRRLDVTLPLRGWPAFAGRVEAARAMHGAAWVGTTSYGLAAELADEPALQAPVLQISERDRYLGLPMGAAPDLSRPGLLIDLTRRIDLAALGRCFEQVQPLGPLIRGATAEAAGKSYTAVLVSGSRRDVVREGCWPVGG